MVATNTGGSRFIKYGDVRRNILALTVVLADNTGTVLELGSDLRKNNTGVDWKQLFIGTGGAFGIITECVLNVEYLPRQIATAYLVPADSASVMPLLMLFERKFGAYLSAFEGMSGNAIATTLDQIASVRNPFQGGKIPDYVILLEISRSWEHRESEQSLDAVLEEALMAAWEGDEALLADAFVGPPNQMWALRHALSEGLKHAGKVIAFDVSFRRQAVTAFCDFMKRKMPEKYPSVTICDFGHIGDGGVHLNLVVDNDSHHLSNPDFEDQLRQWVYSVVVNEFGGSFSAEHGIGRKNQKYYDHYTNGKIRDLAANFKSASGLRQIGAALY